MTMRTRPDRTRPSLLPGLLRRAAVLLAAAVLAAGCGGGENASRTAGRTGADDAVERSDLRIVVVSHGQASDPFWSVVANGLEDGGREMGVQVEYQAPTTFDMVRMSNLIDAAVASRPDGLLVSVPDPDALRASIRTAVEAGIPVLSINSGAAVWEELGLLAHVGQTEYESGYAGGERMAAAGVSRALCVNHEVGNVSLDERCQGFGDALREAGASMDVLAVDLADPDDAQQRVEGALAADGEVDGVLTLGPAGAAPTLAALRSSGALDEVTFATFDLGPEVLRAVRDGDMLFAIDQQPYLQGYLGVVLMTKYLEARVMAGGGDIVRTGPRFVTAGDAGDVIELSERGIR